MKRYIGTKIVLGEPMTADAAIIAGYKTGGHFNDSQGYEVEYEDKYRSWSPKSPFDNAYRLAEGCSFGLALEALKKGCKVARKGWNGKNLCIIPAGNAMHMGHNMQDCLGLKNTQGDMQPGWVASTSDLLADDWELV